MSVPRMKSGGFLCVLAAASCFNSPIVLGQGSSTTLGYHQRPLTVYINPGLKPSLRGDGRIISSPAGIDCPGRCSFLFDPMQSVTLTVYADKNSIARQIGSPCPTAGYSVPERAGNTTGCLLPFHAGGRVDVYIEAFPSPERSPVIIGSGLNPNGPGQSQRNSPSFQGIGQPRPPSLALESNLPPQAASGGGACAGSDCLRILGVRTGTRCNSSSSVEVDVRNDSDLYLRGFVIFNTPNGKVYEPTDLMRPGQVAKGVQYVCMGSSSVARISNIGSDPSLLRYPPKN